jgi:hypothetical protein
MLKKQNGNSYRFYFLDGMDVSKSNERSNTYFSRVLNDKRDEMRKNEKMRFILYTYEGIKLVYASAD